MLRKGILVVLLVGLLAQAVAAQTETKSGSYWGDAGYGTLCVIANIFYMPAKVVYASIGTLTGGLAYILTAGNADTARSIWSPSLGGNYVVTPEMLRGDQPILFNGPSYSNS
jgi:hypothetical protein